MRSYASEKRRRWYSRVALACAVGSLLGCTRGDGPDLQRVRGNVTMDGKPLADASVIYTPKGGGRPSWGMTDKNGNYDLGYTTHGMGAVRGEYVVNISTYREADVDHQTSKATAGRPETVPSTYSSGTALVVEVVDVSKPYDFALKSDASKVVQPRSPFP